MKLLHRAALELDISRTTLWRYVRIMGIQLHHDPYDNRLRLLDTDQIEAIRRACKRTKKLSKRAE